ncbi:MAG: hypothetical protein K2X43_21645 [Hyphomonadaceae bacterium]|nr:hypothetical protein [Hyphomonadaceae bacterium]
MTTRSTTPIAGAMGMRRECARLLVIALGCALASGASLAQSDQRGKAKPVAPREAVGLNPQPEPPSRTRKRHRLKPGEMRGLNPQPEPPMPADRPRR